MTKEPESPCSSGRTADETVCPLLDQDKKTGYCENCEARIKYAVSENMIPASALEPDVDPVVMEARKAVRKPSRPKKKKGGKCSTRRCPRVATVKGKCQPCYNKAYYKAHHPKKEKKMKAVEVTKKDFDYHGEGIFTSKVQESALEKKLKKEAAVVKKT